jgi:hypothetical protein
MMADFLLQGMWVDSKPFTDSGSHADQDLTVLYPVMPDDPSWLWVALLAGGDTSAPNAFSKNQLVVRPNPNSLGNAPLSPASSGGGLQYKWGMNCHDSGGTLQLSEGVPPAGFFALSGFFGERDAGGGNGLWGGMGRYAYVGSEMISQSRASHQIWNDHGSGADDDGSVWQIDFGSWQHNGWSCFVAQTGYDQPGGLFPALDLNKIDFNV